MRLFVITGTCGAGKSTMRDALPDLLDPQRWACVDSDEVGLNWWDYAGTDHEEKYAEDTLKGAVRMAEGRDLVFVTCMNPQTYFEKVSAPEEISATYFIALCPPDDEIRKRLRARPAERGFTSDEIIRPHIEYNQWFRKNRGKFSLFIDNGTEAVDETAKRIADFFLGVPLSGQ